MGIALLIGLMALIGIVILWGVHSVRSYQHKLMETYDNIRIGDKYIMSVMPLHPFDKSRHYDAEIIDKTLAGGKYPWVQFRFEDGSISQSELHDFLMNFEKSNK